MVQFDTSNTNSLQYEFAMAFCHTGQCIPLKRKFDTLQFDPQGRKQIYDILICEDLNCLNVKKDSGWKNYII